MFPIVPGRKKPALIKDYYTLSSTDPEQIRAWWEASPQANIGLDCGKSGLVVVDVDTEQGHGKDGRGGLPSLQIVTGQDAWDTLSSNTPTGGIHYYFQAPVQGSVTTDSGTFGIAGIDTRSKGGYVVLPPSRIGVTRYSWGDSIPIRPFPSNLITKRPDRKDEKGRTNVEAILQDQEFIPETKRNATFIKIAGKLSSWGFSRDEILVMLKQVYENRSEPGSHPMEDSEFETIAKSASSYERETNPLKEMVASAGTVVEASGFYNKTDEAFAVTSATFLANYEEVTSWIVSQMLQRASVNMLQGPPKSGKSTLLRNLALSVAFGLPFLGQFQTQSVPVLCYTLQENKAHLKKYLNTFLTAHGKPLKDIPVDFIFRLPKPGLKAVKGLRQRIMDYGYGFVAIDMFMRFADIDDLNDYVSVDRATAALNELSQDLNVCIIWTHHEKKETPSKDVFSGGIGSQALRGSVYTTLKAWKEHGRRMLASEQRDGVDLEPSAVNLNKQTYGMRLTASGLGLEMLKKEERRERIEALYRNNPKISAKEVHEKEGGRYREVESLLERLRRDG